MMAIWCDIPNYVTDNANEIAISPWQVMGVRYVCLGDECEWAGNATLDNDGGCPSCGQTVVDRWEERAREVQEMGCE